ncbi:MAG: DUF4383 domain-containing protein [Actinomycetota bacterium]|nr:DUF4383 domain-containing protein [Actinomycetota bacterium]
MKETSPARLYALVVGGVLVVAGVIGFFYNTDFSTGSDVPRDAVFGILDVNGWHNVVHLATGVLGLVAAASLVTSRVYALGLGVVYLAVAAWGFAVGDGEVIASLIPINTPDSFLHFALGVAGVAAGLASGAGAPAARATS